MSSTNINLIIQLIAGAIGMPLLPAWRTSLWVQPEIPLLAPSEASVVAKFLVRLFLHLLERRRELIGR